MRAELARAGMSADDDIRAQIMAKQAKLREQKRLRDERERALINMKIANRGNQKMIDQAAAEAAERVRRTEEARAVNEQIRERGLKLGQATPSKGPRSVWQEMNDNDQPHLSGLRKLVEELKAEGSARYEALIQLAVMLEMLATDGARSEIQNLAEVLRNSDAIETICDLMGSDHPRAPQAALISLQALAMDGLDSKNAETRARIHAHGSIRHVVPHLFSSDLAISTVASQIVNHLLIDDAGPQTSLAVVGALNEANGIDRLRVLARMDASQPGQDGLVTAARGCLTKLMESVERANASSVVVKAVTRLQSARRRRIAQNRTLHLIAERRKAILRLQGGVRCARAMRERQRRAKGKREAEEAAARAKWQEQKALASAVILAAVQRTMAVRQYTRTVETRRTSERATIRSARKLLSAVRMAEMEAMAAAKKKADAERKAAEEALRLMREAEEVAAAEAARNAYRAATRLQTNLRRLKAQRDISTEIESRLSAATRLQAMWRWRHVDLSNRHRNARFSEAALLVQSQWRGHSLRKEMTRTQQQGAAAATLLQAGWRSKSVRIAFETQERDAASTIIVNFLRRFKRANDMANLIFAATELAKTQAVKQEQEAMVRAREAEERRRAEQSARSKLTAMTTGVQFASRLQTRAKKASQARAEALQAAQDAEAAKAEADRAMRQEQVARRQRADVGTNRRHAAEAEASAKLAHEAAVAASEHAAALDARAVRMEAEALEELNEALENDAKREARADHARQAARMRRLEMEAKREAKAFDEIERLEKHMDTRRAHEESERGRQAGQPPAVAHARAMQGKEVASSRASEIAVQRKPEQRAVTQQQMKERTTREAASLQVADEVAVAEIAGLEATLPNLVEDKRSNNVPASSLPPSLLPDTVRTNEHVGAYQEAIRPPGQMENDVFETLTGAQYCSRISLPFKSTPRRSASAGSCRPIRASSAALSRRRERPPWASPQRSADDTPSHHVHVQPLDQSTVKTMQREINRTEEAVMQELSRIRHERSMVLRRQSHEAMMRRAEFQATRNDKDLNASLQHRIAINSDMIIRRMYMAKKADLLTGARRPVLRTHLVGPADAIHRRVMQHLSTSLLPSDQNIGSLSRPSSASSSVEVYALPHPRARPSSAPFRRIQ